MSRALHPPEFGPRGRFAHSRLVGPFPHTTTPAIPGLYLRPVRQARLMWSHWDGKKWGSAEVSMDKAVANKGWASQQQACPWYGLAKRPAGMGQRA